MARGVHGRGVCVAGGMHAWQGRVCVAVRDAWWGHVCMARGVCMAQWGVHGRGECVAGGHVWQE